MIDRVLKTLIPYAKWRNVWIGLGLVVFINIAAFPYYLNKLEKVAPGAAIPIDLKFSYSPDEVYQIIKNYEDEGREIYKEIVLKVDTIYPFIYTLTTIFILFLLLKRNFSTSPKMERLALLPMITFFADLFENTGIVSMINGFPERMVTIAKVTSCFSSVKWVMVGVSLLLILFLLLKSGISKK